MSLHSGSEAYRLLKASGGHPPGPMARGAHLSSGAWVPPPDGSAFGSPAWWTSQAMLGAQQQQQQKRPDACPASAPPGEEPVSGTAAAASPEPPTPSPPSDQSIHRSMGSSHALEHYAFLMGIGERSVSGLRKRSMSRAALLEGAAGGSSSRGCARPSLEGKSEFARSSLDGAREGSVLSPKAPSPPDPSFGASYPGVFEKRPQQEATPPT